MAKDKENSKKRCYGRMVNIPILGFIIDFIVAFFRIARNDAKVRELRHDVRRISAEQDRLARALWRNDGDLFDQTSQPREDAWSRHAPAFLNAVSSVGAMGYEIQRQAAELQRQAAAVKRQNLEIQKQQQELNKLIEAHNQLLELNADR